MVCLPILPDSALVRDEEFAAAYDGCADTERAALKSCIARLCDLHGENPLREESCFRTLKRGGKWALHHSPARWALVAWDSSMTSPSRLLAAVLPPVLAGVETVFAVQVEESAHRGSTPIPAAMLTALELAGQEQTACMDAEAALAFATALAEASPSGRLMSLGDDPCLHALRSQAEAARIPAMHLPVPRIGICPSLAGGAGEEKADGRRWGLLGFAQPDAHIRQLDPDDKGNDLDAVLCALPRLRHWLDRVPLTLTPGSESLWYYPELDGFFMQRRNALAE